MTNSVISPYPWDVDHGLNNFHGYPEWSTYSIRDKQNHCIAQIGEVDGSTAPYNKDNAILFGVAPELVEAFIAAKNALKELKYVEAYTKDIVDQSIIYRLEKAVELAEQKITKLERKLQDGK